MAAQFKAFLYATWRSMENTTACRQACWNLLQHQFPWWWSRDYSAYCYHSAGSSWNDFCSNRAVLGFFEMVQVVEVYMVQQLLLVMAQDSQLILSLGKRGTNGILSPPSQSSSKKLHNVASI